MTNKPTSECCEKCKAKGKRGSATYVDCMHPYCPCHKQGEEKVWSESAANFENRKEGLCQCIACKNGMKTGHNVINKFIAENPQPTQSWEERFDKKFKGYWRGTAIADEIKFFIMILRKEAREAGLKDNNKKGDAFRRGCLTGAVEERAEIVKLVEGKIDLLLAGGKTTPYERGDFSPTAQATHLAIGWLKAVLTLINQRK